LVLAERAAARLSHNEVDRYVGGLYWKVTPTATAADLFEVEQTGLYNYRVVGGGVTIDIDGFRGSTILEAKYVGNANRSPYLSGSKAPDFLRDKILRQQEYEFQRFKAVIDDPTVPFSRLDVLTNDAVALPYFRALLNTYNIPGTVLTVPTEVLPSIPRKR